MLADARAVEHCLKIREWCILWLHKWCCPVEVYVAGSASQQSMVCGHGGPRQQQQQQQLTDDDVEKAVVDDSPNQRQRSGVCYQSATTCRTSYDNSPTTLGQGAYPRADADRTIRPARIVIDALPTSPDDGGRGTTRRLPTSQITCRILQPLPPTVASKPDARQYLAVRPAACDHRRYWTSVARTRTSLINGDCRPHRLLTTAHSLETTYRHVDTNGNC